MMNILTLVGLVLVGIIALAVLGVIVWLIVRPAPSAKSASAAARTARPSEVSPENETVPEAAEPQFEVTRGAEGPHPRPRELDRESRRELRLLDERLHRAFFDRAGMSPEEWARIADDLLIVHDRMPVGILVERFEHATDTTVGAPAQTEMSPREVASRLNEQLSPEHRLELLGTLEEPIEADVYAPR